MINMLQDISCDRELGTTSLCAMQIHRYAKQSMSGVLLLAKCPSACTAPALQKCKTVLWKDRAKNSLSLMVVMITPILHIYSLNFFQKGGWGEKKGGVRHRKGGTQTRKEGGKQ